MLRIGESQAPGTPRRLGGGSGLSLRQDESKSSAGPGAGFSRVQAPLPVPPQEIPLHSNVYEVYATDKDEGLNGAVRYSFLKTAGNRDWEYFSIDPVSGLIQTAQRLDREKQAVYSVRWQGPGRLCSCDVLGGPVWESTLEPYASLTPASPSDCAPLPPAHLGSQRPGPASAI